MARTRGAFRAYVARRGASLRGRGRAVAFAALALAACAAPPAEPPAAPAPIVMAPVELVKPVAAVVATAPAAPRPLDKLVGLRAAQLAALLGRPDLRRRDGAAEIWQYRAGACALDFFLYEEKGGLQVAHAETRSRSGPRSIAPCDEASIIAKRRADPVRPAANRT